MFVTHAYCEEDNKTIVEEMVNNTRVRHVMDDSGEMITTVIPRDRKKEKFSTTGSEHMDA